MSSIVPKLLLSASALALMTGLVKAQADNADTFYVSPTGNDLAPGTFAQPVATMREAITRASLRVRATDPVSGGYLSTGVNIFMRGGTYPSMPAETTPLDPAIPVCSADSGRPDAPITISAYMPEGGDAEVPVIDGGISFGHNNGGTWADYTNNAWNGSSASASPKIGSVVIKKFTFDATLKQQLITRFQTLADAGVNGGKFCASDLYVRSGASETRAVRSRHPNNADPTNPRKSVNGGFGADTQNWSITTTVAGYPTYAEQRPHVRINKAWIYDLPTIVQADATKNNPADRSRVV